MTVEGITKVGVIGCGLMGSGIAETVARAGYSTLVREVDQASLDKGMARIGISIEASVQRGKQTAEQRDATLSRLTGTVALDDFADRDLVIEAIYEDLEAKRTIFTRLDQIVPQGRILATNTSSIPVIRIASATKRPELVVGAHFMNPVPILPLVELVRTVATSDATLATMRTFCESLPKRVIVAKDRGGFVVNLLLIPYLLNAIRAFEDGVASREDIDLAMRLGTNMPMGPLTLTDFVGHDTLLMVAEVMYAEFLDPRYAPPPLLRQMVAAGRTGKKTGRGFYDYAAGEEPPK
jgi:3-hydroxybutyryl-CoA dehydrogenase